MKIGSALLSKHPKLVAQRFLILWKCIVYTVLHVLNLLLWEISFENQKKGITQVKVDLVGEGINLPGPTPQGWNLRRWEYFVYKTNSKWPRSERVISTLLSNNLNACYAFPDGIQEKVEKGEKVSHFCCINCNFTANRHMLPFLINNIFSKS